MVDFKHTGLQSPVFTDLHLHPLDRGSAVLTDTSTPTPPSLTSESSPESFVENEDSSNLAPAQKGGEDTSRSGAPVTSNTLLNGSTAVAPSTMSSMYLPSAMDEQMIMSSNALDSVFSPATIDSFDPAHDRYQTHGNISMDADLPSQASVNEEPLSAGVVNSAASSSRLPDTDSSSGVCISPNTNFKPSASVTGLPFSTTDVNSIAPAMMENAVGDSKVPAMSSAQAPLSNAANDASLTLTSIRTIWPSRSNLPSDMKILVNGVPAMGAKSRVETQIRMRIELVHPIPTDNPQVAPQYERIGSFTHIKVPPLSGTKRKSKKHQKLHVPLESTLVLDAEVINATPPHSRVYVCNSCRERERKRAHRKKSKVSLQTINPTEEEMSAIGIDPKSPDAVERAVSYLEEEERKHAVLFNCGDYVDFHDGEVVLSTRITCYCRHHREKIGFHIIFTLRNHKGEFIATGSTPPIMIMDDHKSVSQAATVSRLNESRLRSNAQDRAFSPSRTIETPSRMRDRPKPYDDSSRYRRSLPRETSQPPLLQDSSRMSFPVSESVGASWLRSVSPASLDESMPNSSMTLHEAALSSPVQMSGLPPFPPLPRLSEDHRSEASVSLSIPRITKLVPVEGPTTGGIEITVLGENFRNGIQCVFGDMPSTFTRVWAPTTLVCILPPSFRPGPVIVRLQDPTPPQALLEPGGSHPLQLFTYIDSTDRALMELALQVVGIQMTGQFTSARDIAMRIVSASQGNEASSSRGMASQGNGVGNGMCNTLSSGSGVPDVSDVLSSGLRLNSTRSSKLPGVQDSLLGFLTLLDVDMNSSSDKPFQRNAIHACNSSGHTLLHLAVIHNFHRLVSDLLHRGCPVNARDANGYTALHFAALHGWMEVTKLLLLHGANPYDINEEGLIPLEVARRSEKIDVERMLIEWVQYDDNESLDAEVGNDTSDEEITMSDADEELDYYVDDETETEADDEAEDADEQNRGKREEHDTSESEEWVSYGDLASIDRVSCSSSAPGLSTERERRIPASPDQPHPRRPNNLLQALPPWDHEVKLPGPIHSPPPTYDEATTTFKGEPSSSKHIDGEKLITSPDSLTLSRSQHPMTLANERELAYIRKERRSNRMARHRRSNERSKETATETVVRPRQGVYDDRMLLWFWIPAMLLALLVPFVLQTRTFASFYEGSWLQRITQLTSPS